VSIARAVRSVSSIKRFSNAESDIPWQRATAAKRSLVSFETQVLRCVLSLIESDFVPNSRRKAILRFTQNSAETSQLVRFRSWSAS
jgi:hypothetical protein